MYQACRHEQRLNKPVSLGPFPQDESRLPDGPPGRFFDVFSTFSVFKRSVASAQRPPERLSDACGQALCNRLRKATNPSDPTTRQPSPHTHPSRPWHSKRAPEASTCPFILVHTGPLRPTGGLPQAVRAPAQPTSKSCQKCSSGRAPGRTGTASCKTVELTVLRLDSDLIG